MLKNIVRNKTISFDSMMAQETEVVLSKAEFQKLIGQNDLVEHKEDNFDSIEIIEEGSNIVSVEEIADYIVENPREVVVEFPIISDVKMEEKLPFFKSVVFKLGGI